MIATRNKIEIIIVSLIVLFSVLACHVVSTLEINNAETSIQKRVTLSNNLEKKKEENLGSRKGWKKIKEFVHKKNQLGFSEGYPKNDYAIRKEEDELVTKYDEINHLRSDKIEESEINIKDNWKKYFLVFTDNGKPRKNISNSMEEKLTNRINRNINEENISNELTLNRNVRAINTTDYYAQRKAVMDKFHARQREIATKYGKRYYNNSSSRIVHKNNQTLDESNKTFKNRNDPNLDIFKVASNTSSYESRLKNIKINQNKENLKNVKSEIDGNILRDITNYTLPIIRNCTNITLHGSYSKQTRNKLTLSCTNKENELIVKRTNESPPSRPNRAIDGNLVWGTCNGTLVYQHNLLLNLKGPSNLEAIFEVTIDGPLCITCVKVLPINDTEENVSKESGGPDHRYVKLKFKGPENKGFSYTIKVWAVTKKNDTCG
ncbi:hypothetical protein HZH68_011382 [Vespula germanica]|uniref:Uncharacterized protein n=1 Tax=Vespula germanica TaxID=30212 RepID=A0A834JP18_VESGE|nr:hypothetical protein HZH68_011382 [Vespula germanica]